MPDWLPPPVANGDPRRATYALTRLLLVIFATGPARELDSSGRTVYNAPSSEQNTREVYGLSGIIVLLALAATAIAFWPLMGWKSLLLLPLVPFVLALILNVLLMVFAALAWPFRKVFPVDELPLNGRLYHLLFLGLALSFVRSESALRWIGAFWLALVGLNAIAFIVLSTFMRLRRVVQT